MSIMCWSVRDIASHHGSSCFVDPTRSRTVTVCCNANNLQDMASDIQAHRADLIITVIIIMIIMINSLSSS